MQATWAHGLRSRATFFSKGELHVITAVCNEGAMLFMELCGCGAIKKSGPAAQLDR